MHQLSCFMYTYILIEQRFYDDCIELENKGPDFRPGRVSTIIIKPRRHHYLFHAKIMVSPCYMRSRHTRSGLNSIPLFSFFNSFYIIIHIQKYCYQVCEIWLFCQCFTYKLIKQPKTRITLRISTVLYRLI